MKMLVNMKFGSFLYGTNNENSDTDYKGVYLPELKEVVIGKYAKNINVQTNKHGKNSNEDIDTEIYALQEFLKLAFQGETVALDMIHARHTLEQTSPEWEFIYQNRAKLYQKNMKSYLGYCRGQAAKYGVKGTRLNDCKTIIDIFKKYDPETKLSDFWDAIPQTENVKKIVNLEHLNGDNRFLDVCGKHLQASSSVRNSIKPLEKFYKEYGHRAHLAATAGGVDWKAISHAFRAAFQLIEIMETGDLKFPLKQATFLREIKEGKYNYEEDKLGEQLDTLIEICNLLIDKSKYPEQVDKDFWNDWLYSLYVKKQGDEITS